METPIVLNSQAAKLKAPGPDHPIAIGAYPARIIVSVAGQLVADTCRALALREASYPTVLYIPRADVNMALLERTAHTTHCPYKGIANYYSIPAGQPRSNNAVWTYETPSPWVGQIRNHLAFYPDRVDAIQEHPLP